MRALANTSMVSRSGAMFEGTPSCTVVVILSARNPDSQVSLGLRVSNGNSGSTSLWYKIRSAIGGAAGQ